jgi:methionyl-tRNA formyltransferase
MGKSTYVFFGTPFFAAHILETLIKNNIVPSLIVTNPDKPVGRKKIITPSPVKKIALEKNIKVFEPEKLSQEEFEKFYSGEKFGILAAYGKIIPLGIIKKFEKGIIVVHPSLLPQYRGPTPIQAAILNGDKETGTTLFLMDEYVDHGPILSQEKLSIEKETFSELQEKLADLSSSLLLKTIPLFLENKIVPCPQDEKYATYTKKFTIDDAFVSPQDLKEAEENSPVKALIIWRKIRALNPEPGVWTIIDGVRTKLLEADIKNNKLKITKIQKAGGKPITLN